MKAIDGGKAALENLGLDKYRCRDCGGVSIVPVVAAPFIHKGELRGGTETLYCFDCLLSGKRTTVGLSRDRMGINKIETV